jgi:hypothetical protein
MKLSFVMKFAALFLCASQLYSLDTIKDKHLESYVSECIEYWFYPNQEYSEIRKLTKLICQDIRGSNQESFTWNWNSLAFEYGYKREYIEQLMRGAVIDYVKERSYEIARKFGSSQTAAKVSQIIANELFELCSQSIEMRGSIFSSYAGRALRERVEHLYHWVLNNGDYISPSSTVIAHLYPSDDCCICYDSFNEVSRVFLAPCGHDICVTCAERWFYTENKKSCPQCRQTVDKKALRQAINQAILAVAY